MNHANGPLHIGVISDTHGLLRPEALAALAGADHILHAGDVGDPDILDRLREIAPVTAIRGNIDVHGPCALLLPPTEAIELGGCLIYIVHDLNDLDISPAAAGVGIVLCGHSHKASIREQNGVLYLNPGSAGPRRFTLPVTVALLRCQSGKASAEIVTLNVAP